MTIFTPETPLGQAVQKLLMAAPDGLPIQHIRRQLRNQGQQVSLDNLRELLKHSCFAEQANGNFTLTSREQARFIDERTELSPELTEAGPVYLKNIPYAKDRYIVFDLETTGTNPAHDCIIQIAALKVIDGQLHAIRNWRVNPGGISIPYSLQLKLGIADNPIMQDALRAAPPIESVLPEFMAFTDGLPLVAHNVRFDLAFLEAALRGRTIPNRLVDTLEAALLMLPALENHQLEKVACALGLSMDLLASEWNTIPATPEIAGHSLSETTFHNALTDVYVLHRVYQRLLERFHQPSIEGDLLQQLIPEMYHSDAAYSGVDIELVKRIAAQCDWSMPGNVTNNLPPAADGLRSYLAQRGLTPRVGQMEMQQLIQEALAAPAYTMVEAPTGTGKTLAYLTAAVHEAVESGSQIGLSTAYRNLQDQLINEIAAYQSFLGNAFTVQLLKGVSNYFCWTQMIRYLEDGDPQSDHASHELALIERFVLAYLILWMPRSATGTNDLIAYWLLSTFPIARAIVAQVAASSACNPDFQDTCAHCPMPSAYSNARRANLVVVNHALILSQAKRLPTLARLVFDEAHTLEDVATEAFTEEVSSKSLGDLLDRLFDCRYERGLLIRLVASARDTQAQVAARGAIASVRELKPLVEEFGRFVARFIRRCTSRMDPQFGAALRLEAPPYQIYRRPWAEINQAHQQLFQLYVQNLRQALDRVYESTGASSNIPHREAILTELNELSQALDEQYLFAHEFPRVADTKMVYWVEVGPPIDPESNERDPQPEWWAFRRAPLDIGQALQPMYDEAESLCFVSATLTIRNKDFSFFINRLGLSQRLDSSFVRQLAPALPYQENVLLGLANYLNYAPLERTMESFEEELAAELKLLLRFTNGRTLTLFTARSRMERIAQRLEAVLAEHGIPLYVATAGQSRQRLLEDFKAICEAVLFGLRSFWEGVDAPGETLSFVVMEKLPFPLLISPIHRARAAYLQTQGKSEFEDYMLPLMLLQFKQGFGRLMRRETDRGAVILFDKRIHRKHYKADLLDALPGYLPRDEEAERSRRAFYEHLAATFPDLIDVSTKQDLLRELPEHIQLDLDALLARFELPVKIPRDEFEKWRSVLLDAMQTLFGHKAFNRIHGVAAQEEVIQAILAGEDTLGVLPTGSGKSLTFQLTALLRDGVTLVFSPLIALMKDQVSSLADKGIEVVGAIYSGQSTSERDDVLERMQNGRARLVYISPERLRDPQVLTALKQTRVIQVVVDEAHCIYMWGQTFRPDFLYLPRLFDRLEHRPPVLALTATATPAIRAAIVDTLSLSNPTEIIVPIQRAELRFSIYNSMSQFGRIRSRNDRFRQLLRILNAADKTRPPMLIYVATTAEADQLARQLHAMGFDARAYHGKLESAERASVQELFMDDHINIVVCTKAFGMGIDKPDIRYVIHYNLPGDLESYFQEAGRAGRDGQPAYCILLYHKSDVETQEYFIDNSTPDAETINRVLRYLAADPDPVLFLDPRAVQEQLGVEDVQLRVALHHLEAQAFLWRDVDFTQRAAVTLQKEFRELATVLQKDPDFELLSEIVRKGTVLPFRRTELDLLALGKSLGQPPTEIERILLRLATEGYAIYRPWERGFIVRKSSELTMTSTVTAGDLAADQHREVMRQKLWAMISYAETSSQCLQSVILQYFGQPATDCGHCNVCNPQQEWPWSKVSSRDLVTPSDFVDPAFTILELVKWNLDRAKQYGAPYGIGALVAILTGNRYQAIAHEQDLHLRRWRLQQMQACPLWGVLALMSNPNATIESHILRLVREGYLSREKHRFSDGSEYDYLALTPKGVDQLTSGRLLQW